MLLAGFKPAIQTIKRPQTYTTDRMASGIGVFLNISQYFQAYMLVKSTWQQDLQLDSCLYKIHEHTLSRRALLSGVETFHIRTVIV